jgi:hypothetical protein
MRMSAATIILVAALVLDIGAVLFFRMSGQDPSTTPKMVAICVAAIVTVGAAIVQFHGLGARQWNAVVAETNAAMRALADHAKLDFVEPPREADSGSASAAFAEARGSYCGVQMRVSVEPVATDHLSMALLFPRLAVDEKQLGSLSDVADRIARDGGGITLFLDRRPRFWLFVDYDRIPESNVARLESALERVCALARDAQGAK